MWARGDERRLAIVAGTGRLRDVATDEEPVTEYGVLTIRPGQEEAFEAAMRDAQPLIAGADGFRGLRLARCVERPGSYLLLVEWDSLTAHTEGFRGSDAYQGWRAALHHFYDPTPTIEHATTVLRTLDANSPELGG